MTRLQVRYPRVNHKNWNLSLTRVISSRSICPKKLSAAEAIPTQCALGLISVFWLEVHGSIPWRFLTLKHGFHCRFWLPNSCLVLFCDDLIPENEELKSSLPQKMNVAWDVAFTKPATQSTNKVSQAPATPAAADNVSPMPYSSLANWYGRSRKLEEVMIWSMHFLSLYSQAASILACWVNNNLWWTSALKCQWSSKKYKRNNLKLA